MRGGGAGRGESSRGATKKRARRAPSGSGSSSGARSAASDIVRRLRREGIRRAKIGSFDIDGVLRGKYVSLEKLESALAKGFGFCDVIFGWDVGDVLYDGAQVTGWHTGYPDAQAWIDPTTERRIPWEPGVAAFLADFLDSSGQRHPACPRSLLRHVLARLESLGLGAKVALEFEFLVFRETRESLVSKNFTNLEPLDPGMFGYSWLRTGQDAELMADLQDTLAAAGIAVEGLHTETGPGVYEAALAVTDPLRAADD